MDNTNITIENMKITTFSNHEEKVLDSTTIDLTKLASTNLSYIYKYKYIYIYI